MFRLWQHAGQCWPGRCRRQRYPSQARSSCLISSALLGCVAVCRRVSPIPCDASSQPVRRPDPEAGEGPGGARWTWLVAFSDLKLGAWPLISLLSRPLDKELQGMANIALVCR